MKNLDGIVENICIAITLMTFMICCSYTVTHNSNNESNFEKEKLDTTIIK